MRVDLILQSLQFQLAHFALIIAPALRQQTNFVDHVVDGARQKSEFVGAGIIDFQPDFLIAFRIAGGNHIINGVHDAAVDKQCQEHTDNDQHCGQRNKHHIDGSCAVGNAGLRNRGRQIHIIGCVVFENCQCIYAVQLT